MLDIVVIAGRDATLAPQYLSGVSVVKIGAENLLYLYTTWASGGSGSLHYFQFFKVAGTHLQLVRAFEHVRMEQGFFTLHNERIYDRGHIVQTRNERLEERTGNRFLSESYKNMSLHAAILRNGHFPP